MNSCAFVYLQKRQNSLTMLKPSDMEKYNHFAALICIYAQICYVNHVVKNALFTLDAYPHSKMAYHFIRKTKNLTAPFDVVQHGLCLI